MTAVDATRSGVMPTNHTELLFLLFAALVPVLPAMMLGLLAYQLSNTPADVPTPFVAPDRRSTAWAATCGATTCTPAVRFTATVWPRLSVIDRTGAGTLYLPPFAIAA